MSDELFLAECEAKANEATTIAEKATDGPYKVVVMAQTITIRPVWAEHLNHEIATVHSWVAGPSNAAFPGSDGCGNAEFAAHARTSNPDLAARVR